MSVATATITLPPATAPATAPAPAGWVDGPSSGWSSGAAAGCACDRTVFRPGSLDRLEVTSPERAAELVLPVLGGADREHCVAALLDTKHRLVELVTVSIGSNRPHVHGPA